MCYGNHLRKDCTEEKLSWSDYLKLFRSKNPEILDELWIKIIKDDYSKMPKETDFNLPTTKEECDQILALMLSCRIDRVTGISMLKERKEKFELAVKVYNSKKTQIN